MGQAPGLIFLPADCEWRPSRENIATWDSRREKHTIRLTGFFPDSAAAGDCTLGGLALLPNSGGVPGLLRMGSKSSISSEQILARLPNLGLLARALSTLERLAREVVGTGVLSAISTLTGGLGVLQGIATGTCGNNCGAGERGHCMLVVLTRFETWRRDFLIQKTI